MFLDFAHPDGRTIGRVTVLLYPDIVPITARNFMELVLNYKRDLNVRLKCKTPPTKSMFWHYVGSPICTINQNTYIELGDLTRRKEIEGQSKYGKDFDPENFCLKADRPGTCRFIGGILRL